MPHHLQIFSQSDYSIQIVDINSHTEWQTVQIQISWLLQKPTDLDLHCLKMQDISGFSRTRVKRLFLLILLMEVGVVGWCEGAVYLRSPGRPTDIGLQLGKACYPCSG